ncbi:MAG: TRAP transporter small permease [Candidatus Shapirobacteria bacterium]|jgi:TRAP-type C4-dicarboxylate transport system permease small subunit
MSIPPRLRKTGKFFVDLIELYVPIVAFCTLFISFMTQIVARYFFKPLIWPEELSLICFVWVALLGGLYAKRDNSHVAFGMVYDAVKPKTQAWMRIAGNGLLIVAFIGALYPSFTYVTFMGYKHSDALKISMTLAYFPFVVFLADMIIRLAIDLVRDISSLRKGEIQ